MQQYFTLALHFSLSALPSLLTSLLCTALEQGHDESAEFIIFSSIYVEILNKTEPLTDHCRLKQIKNANRIFKKVFILAQEASQRGSESALYFLHGTCKIVPQHERYHPLSSTSGAQTAQHLKTGRRKKLDKVFSPFFSFKLRDLNQYTFIHSLISENSCDKCACLNWPKLMVID